MIDDDEDQELDVWESADGRFYIGTLASRDSIYYDSREEAQQKLDNRCWTQRMDP
jgi:hypothetical protein